MCPPPSIDTYWTDEGIALLLDHVQRGDHVPSNVLTDVNLHECHPSNLPDGVWYYLRPQPQVGTETEIGFWKAKGDTCHIYSGPGVNGWRTTLEFYEGKCPNEHRTDWMMQEYRITRNVPDSPEVLHSWNLPTLNASMLCIFSSTNLPVKRGCGYSPFREMVRYVEFSSVIMEGVWTTDCIKIRMVKMLVVTTAFLLLIIEIAPLFKINGSGDYVELGDLLVPDSSSSSSVNSSRPSVSSNELFDFLEIDDLAPENSQENKPKSTGHNYRIPASSALTEVVLSPATEGTMVRSFTIDSATESVKAGNTIPGPAAKEKKLPEQGGLTDGGQSCARKGSPSNLKNHVAAPSSSEKSVPPMVEKKRAVSKKKGRSWYLCCLPY